MAAIFYVEYMNVPNALNEYSVVFHTVQYCSFWQLAVGRGLEGVTRKVLIDENASLVNDWLI